MNGFRALPSVDQLLQTESVAQLIDTYGRQLVTATARAALDAARAAIIVTMAAWENKRSMGCHHRE